ncbi:tandem-95 repeat protein [Bdellovibrionales bacterium]|nr:tandem-95 repeat protein [Bdellovibrionales bacterium]
MSPAGDDVESGSDLTYTLDKANVINSLSTKNGRITRDAKGFAYQPNWFFTGEDHVDIYLADRDGGVVRESITFNVGAFTPSFKFSDQFTVLEDQTLTNQITLLSGELSGVTLTYQVVSQPAHGAIQLNPNGAFTYKPSKNYHGVDKLAIRAKYKDLYSSQFDVSINVRSVNDSPKVRTPIHITLESFQKFDIDIQASDVDGDPLTYTVSKAPEHGFLSEKRPLFTYRSHLNYIGSDRFEIKVTDSSGLSAVSQVYITVKSRLNTLKPALAIRGAGCILCHAKVNSNIYTDMGFSKTSHDNFFGRGPTNYSPYHNPAVGIFRKIDAENYEPTGTTSAFGSLSLLGTLFLPENTQIPSAHRSYYGYQNSLFDYINTLASGFKRLKYNFFRIPEMIPLNNGHSVQVMTAGAIQGTGQPLSALNIAKKQNIFIGAPTDSAIRKLFSSQSPSPGEIEYFLDPTGSSHSSPAWINRLPQYATNSGVMNCDGDLVVNGLLVLNRATIRTKNGCRIYASQPVVIIGALTVLGTTGNYPHTNSNVQISSSKGVLFGVSGDYLRYLYATTYSKYLLTRRAPSDSESRNQFIDFARQLESTPYNSTIRPESVSYNRLLVNAPIVLGRNKGNFSGVIIAETGYLNIGSFNFTFDSVFSRAIPFLPLLNGDTILKIE